MLGNITPALMFPHAAVCLLSLSPRSFSSLRLLTGFHQSPENGFLEVLDIQMISALIGSCQSHSWRETSSRLPETEAWKRPTLGLESTFLCVCVCVFIIQRAGHGSKKLGKDQLVGPF